MIVNDNSQVDKPVSRGELIFLLLTALLCGAFVMVIEVLGSRVIGPFFGVSLFVWSSLIAVAMIALAAGYTLGGRIADRFEHADGLYCLTRLTCIRSLNRVRKPRQVISVLSLTMGIR